MIPPSFFAWPETQLDTVLYGSLVQTFPFKAFFASL